MAGKMKVMVHRAIAILFIAFSFSCEDRKGEHLTPNKVYFPNSGVIEVDMYNFGEDFDYKLGLYKSGYFDDAASVSVRTMTVAELSEYDETGELAVIPADCYTMSGTRLEFDSKDRNKYIDVTFFPDKISAIPASGKQFVLPLIIDNTDQEINEEKNVVLLAPKVTEPVIYFEEYGVVPHFVEVMGEPLSQANFSIRTNFDNIWSINGTIAIDQEALNAYNQENATSFPILPAAAYTLNSAFVLQSDQNIAQLNITFNRNNFPNLGVYILPLTIQSVSRYGADEERKTILVRVNYGGNIIELNNPTWTIVDFSSQQENQSSPATNILDGNFSTMWQRRYGWCDQVDYPCPSLLPHHITIDMQQLKGVTRVEVHRRSGTFADTHAGKIQISADNVNWTEIGEFRFPEPVNESVTMAGTGDLSMAVGRYLKVIVTQSFRRGAASHEANITELKVYGPE